MLQQFKPSRWEVGIPVRFLEGLFPLRMLHAPWFTQFSSVVRCSVSSFDRKGRCIVLCCTAPGNQWKMENGKCQCDKSQMLTGAGGIRHPFLPRTKTSISTQKQQRPAKTCKRPANDLHDIPENAKTQKT